MTEFTANELAVRHALQAHRGRAHAIRLPDLAEAVALSAREVQDVVKHLIEAHQLPIGSRCSRPHGYYWIIDAEDQSAAERQLEHRIISCARRLARLKRNTPHEVLGQLLLTLGSDPLPAVAAGSDPSPEGPP